MILTNPVAAAREVLGDRLAAVLIFGSYARPQDASPLSDVNIAIIASNKPSPIERIGIYSMLPSPASPLVIGLEELHTLWLKGDFIAHMLHADSKALYLTSRAADLLSDPPPVTEKTTGYLRRYSASALGIALENHLARRWGGSLNYSYRGYRAAARFVAAAKYSKIPFPDSEVIAFLSRRKQGAVEYRRLRALRRLGGGERESLSALEIAASGVARLLGVERFEVDGVLERLRGKRVGVVRVVEENGSLRVYAGIVEKSGGLRENVIWP